MTFTDIISSVKERIGSSKSAPVDRVVESLAEAEIDRRAALVRKGYEAYKETQAELSKIKPSHTEYDEDGDGIGEPSYTREQAEKMRKLRERLAKQDKALALAHEQGDYSGLEK